MPWMEKKIFTGLCWANLLESESLKNQDVDKVNIVCLLWQDEKKIQEKQCTYYVTLRRVRVTTVAVSKRQILIFFNRYTVHSDIDTVHSPTNSLSLDLERFKIHTNVAHTCFGLRPSSGSLYWAWLKLYSAQHTTHKSLKDMLPHYRIIQGYSKWLSWF
jgi:hypothetical protein